MYALYVCGVYYTDQYSFITLPLLPLSRCMYIQYVYVCTYVNIRVCMYVCMYVCVFHRYLGEFDRVHDDAQLLQVFTAVSREACPSQETRSAQQ